VKHGEIVASERCEALIAVGVGIGWLSSGVEDEKQISIDEVCG